MGREKAREADGGREQASVRCRSCMSGITQLPSARITQLPSARITQDCVGLSGDVVRERAACRLQSAEGSSG